MSALTPVEALQRVIEIERRDIDEALARGHMPYPNEFLLVAALEFAKADAELQAVIQKGDYIGMDEGLLLSDALDHSRIALYEALKL
jgi:hypothetical protein